MKILITAALNEELLPLKNILRAGFSRERFAGFTFLKTGLGIKKSSKIFRDHLKNNSYNFVLNIGTAGSLDRNIKIGSIFFPTQFSSLSQGDVLTIENPISHSVFIPPNWKLGELFTSLKPIDNPQKKRKLKLLTSSKAVDMETFGIAYICRENNIPFSAIKVITDHAQSITKERFLENLKNNQNQLHSAIKIFIEQNLLTPEKVGEL